MGTAGLLPLEIKAVTQTRVNAKLDQLDCRKQTTTVTTTTTTATKTTIIDITLNDGDDLSNNDANENSDSSRRPVSRTMSFCFLFFPAGTITEVGQSDCRLRADFTIHSIASVGEFSQQKNSARSQPRRTFTTRGKFERLDNRLFGPDL